jgi:thioredoxin-related protein
MKRLSILILTLFSMFFAFGQGTKPATAKAVVNAKPQSIAPKTEEKIHINWISVAEATEKMKTQKRKIFVDIYTDWCGWCKKMDQSTFSDKNIVKYINENYYAIHFDAEQKNDVIWNGKTYKFVAQGNRGYHELAAEWMGGRMSYPTTIYTDENYGLIQAIPGYLETEKFDKIIHYFGTDSHKKTPWETYEKNYVMVRD